MKTIDAATIDRVLTRAGMVEALRAGFREAVVTPVRHHHPMIRATNPTPCCC